jgi:hypothetical protein
VTIDMKNKNKETARGVGLDSAFTEAALWTTWGPYAERRVSDRRHLGTNTA